MTGPFSSARFLVEIDGLSTSGFSRVRLPGQHLQEIPHRNGGDGSRTSSLGGLERPDHFVVSRGVTDDVDLWRWWQEARDRNGSPRDVAVVLLDNTGQEVARWNVIGCDPISYWLSPLDALVDEVLTETLVMSTQRVDRAV